MRTRTKLVTTFALATALVAAPTAAVAGSGDHHRSSGGGHHSSAGAHQGHRAVGLVDGTSLVTFDVTRPGKVKQTGSVAGLDQDTRLVGIDARIQDRNVYGLGDRGGVYTLDPHTAKATFVLRLTVPLEGEAFGVDFNPAANALRVVSDTGQNLRQPFATPGAATIVDGSLTTPPATGTTTGITAAAYTNNDLDDATSTTLFVIDTAAGGVAVQSPANSGTLAATGQLGIDLPEGADIGFDVTGTTGYAVVADDGGSTVYEVSLLTGKATKTGHLGAPVGDLALQLR